jgi:hypothetical protein
MKAQGAPLETTTSICDLSLFNVKRQPFPYVDNNQFIKPEYYSQLCRSFPVCPPSSGPTGFSLFWGDEDYDRLLAEQPAWQALFNTFHSQSFINWGKQQFADIFERQGCKIDLSEARYVPYCEHRIDKERATLRKIIHEPNELWVRMDIHQGRVGYDRRIHLDHARRLISMLIYMCDHTENQMVGGELFLHSAMKPQDLEIPTRITPRHNLMIAFPCTNDSYHSVSRITSTAVPRNYVQVHISSSVDVWPRDVSPWRRGRMLSRLKQRFRYGHGK